MHTIIMGNFHWTWQGKSAFHRVVKFQVKTLDDLTNAAHPNMEQKFTANQWLCERAKKIIANRNESCSKLEAP